MDFDCSNCCRYWTDHAMEKLGNFLLRTSKAIELATGKIAHTWSEIICGKQIGSIQLGDPPPPVMAFNQRLGRFAVAGDRKIHIVSLHDCE